MNTTSFSPFSPAGTRALVLGGGGSTGNAWLIGVVAGLHDGGVDLTVADVIVGTSAGSTAAAQITGAPPLRLFTEALSPVPTPPAAPASSGAPSPSDRVHEHLERMDRIIAASADVSDLRRRLGAAALEADASPDASERWRSVVAARLPSPFWPDRRLLITAVDAHTGEPTIFDRHSGIELVDAVAASCASGFAYRVGDRAYIDGGFRSGAENADLAHGYDRVLVLAPFGGASRTPQAWGMNLAAQVDGLRATGSLVDTVIPESAAEPLFGAQAMDVTLRPAAAQAGHDQGRELAGRLSEFWG